MLFNYYEVLVHNRQLPFVRLLPGQASVLYFWWLPIAKYPQNFSSRIRYHGRFLKLTFCVSPYLLFYRVSLRRLSYAQKSMLASTDKTLMYTHSIPQTRPQFKQRYWNRYVGLLRFSSLTHFLMLSKTRSGYCYWPSKLLYRHCC